MAEDAPATQTTAEPPTGPHLTWKMPANTPEILRLIMAHGNTCFTDPTGREVAGTPDNPGPFLPCSGADASSIAANRLTSGATGKYPGMSTTRGGRYYAQHGSLAGFDDTTTDLDLAAWARGDLNYSYDELFEAVEAFHYEVVSTPAEALIVLLQKGVITPAEARRDV
jgi:hypothetical protein